MIHKLRKRHLMMWKVLFLLLVLGLIGSWALRPVFPTGELVGEATPEPEGKILQEYQAGGIKVNLRGGQQVEQLELNVLVPIKSPMATVFWTEKDKTVRMAGQIGKRGVYRFPVPKEMPYDGMVVFDPLKGDTLGVVQFQKAKNGSGL
ncbi:hypothetical protein FUAX_22400 [Fulvitalea axinellae]|uniref:Uncharacterized protein n=1 Tax=Fulvitalea axinellae TaxID=1182444 RepID=A0AAU9CIC7_9BACT|nr:hypothetical protein FUAX_22400 [Fulvitalea axinellae]